MIGVAAVGIRTNMRVQQKGLAVFDDAVGVFEIGFAFADGLDLCSAEGDACFEFIGQKVVVPGGAVDGGVTGAGATGSLGRDAGLVFWGAAGAT